MTPILLRLIAILLLGGSLRVSGQDSITVTGNRSFPDARFYFKGEGHEYPAANARALMALLKYTYTEKNVRYLVMEFGPNQAYLANYYLKYGGDSFPSENLLYMGEAFWKHLYAFNAVLPEAQKIQLRGFDFNRYLHTSRALKLMFHGKPQVRDRELRDALFKLIDWETVLWNMDFQKYFAKDIERARLLSAAHEEELRKILGGDYPVYVSILQNKTPISPSVKRDEKMLPQLLAALPGMSGGNILFNYGLAHTALDGVGVAEHLYRPENFRDSVCSIFPFYRNNDKDEALVKIEKKITAHDRATAERSKGLTLIPVDPSSKFKRAGWILVHP